MSNYDRMTPFWFYSSFLQWIKEARFSEKEMFLMKVIEYGTEGTSDLSGISNPTLRAIFPQIKSSIVANQNRHIEAIKNGRKGGRPMKIRSKEFIEELWYMVERKFPPRDIAKHFEISISTVYRCIKRYPLPQEILNAKKEGRKYYLGQHLFFKGVEIDVLGFSEPTERDRAEGRAGPVPIEYLKKAEQERLEAERWQKRRAEASDASLGINGRALYQRNKQQKACTLSATNHSCNTE